MDLDNIFRQDGDVLRMEDDDRDYEYEAMMRDMDLARDERLYGDRF